VQTENEPFTIMTGEWAVRVRKPDKTSGPPRAMLLIHGWTGDENVMWIFTRKFWNDYWLFAPRGTMPSPGGGYGWHPHVESGWPRLEEFEAVMGKLVTSYPTWVNEAGAPEGLATLPFDMMGFSQGAAASYAAAAYYPEQVGRVAALAGFIPLPGDGDESKFEGLRDKHFYVAHGSNDETVPVEMAREAVRILEENGAHVIYCESDVGHKLSASCLRGVETFFNVEKMPPGQ
jgi:phospholipase/carboxylesterase